MEDFLKSKNDLSDEICLISFMEEQTDQSVEFLVEWGEE